jgi:hypothetical protein
MTPIENLMNMNETELAELNTKLKKRAVKKFLMKIASGVVIHFAVGFIITMIETKQEKKKSLEK